jgi:hypothetical protein
MVAKEKTTAGDSNKGAAKLRLKKETVQDLDVKEKGGKVRGGAGKASNTAQFCICQIAKLTR